MNNLKVYLFLSGLTLLWLILGGFIAGHGGFILMLFVMAIVDFVAFFYADRSVLRQFHAREIDDHDATQLRPVLKSLAEKAGIAAPKLFLIESDAPNACALGRDPARASIAITSGLLRLLNAEELNAVLAHELHLIRSQGMFVGCVAASVAGGISNLANLSVWKVLFGAKEKNSDQKTVWPVMEIVGRIAAFFVKILISPDRIFAADKIAVMLCGNEKSLFSALEKIKQHAILFESAELHPSTAHLFFANPLTNVKLCAWFNTFPTIENRLKQL